MKYFVPAILFVLVCWCHSLAQQSKLDSLMNLEKSYKINDSYHSKLLGLIGNMIHKSDPARSLQWYDRAIIMAQEAKDRKLEAKGMFNRARALRDTGNPHLSIESYKKSLAINTEIQDTLGIAQCMSNIGIILQEELSSPSEAIPYYLKATELHIAVHNNLYVPSSYRALSDAYYQTNDLIKAVDAIIKSYSFAEAIHDTLNMIIAYKTLNDYFRDTGEFDKSLEYGEKALSLAKMTNNDPQTMSIYEYLAGTYQSKKDYTNSLKYYLKAHNIYFSLLSQDKSRLNQFPNFLQMNYRNIGNVMIKVPDTAKSVLRLADLYKENDTGTTDKYKVAIKYLNEALKIEDCYHNKESMGLSVIYLSLGDAYKNLNDYNLAKKYYILSYNICKKNDTYVYWQGVSSEYLSDIYEKLNQYDSAYFYYKIFVGVKDSLINKDKKLETSRLEMKHEYEKKERDLQCQKDKSDLIAQQANDELQRQYLLVRTREQDLLLKGKELELNQRAKEFSHLAYLKKMAELQATQLEKTDKEKQLSLSKKENSLQLMKLSNRSLQRNILVLGILLSLISLFFIFRNYRNQRRANRNLREAQEQLIAVEKQKETETIRRRISQDIHDDISSGLTRIAWLSEFAREKVKSNDSREADTSLDKIVASSRETIERLGEIIWAINPEKDNLEGFFAYLRTYVANYLEGRDVTLSLDFPEEKLNLHFNPDLKRTLFLVIKEAIHNVVKHAEATRLEVSFQCPDHHYNIKIADDGKGFDPEHAHGRSNGLANMRQRMESVGGEIEIISQPGTGTQVLLKGMVYS